MVVPKVRNVSDKARERAAQRKLHIYHVAPSAVRESIQRSGIEPAIYARDRQRVAWYVEANAVMFAIVQCAARHHLTFDQIDVWIIPRSSFKKLERGGALYHYKSACHVKPSLFMSAFRALEKETEWLSTIS